MVTCHETLRVRAEPFRQWRHAQSAADAGTDTGCGAERIFRQGLQRSARRCHRAACGDQQTDALSLLRRQGTIVSRGAAAEDGATRGLAGGVADGSDRASALLV